MGDVRCCEKFIEVLGSGWYEVGAFGGENGLFESNEWETCIGETLCYAEKSPEPSLSNLSLKAGNMGF